jgi:hypothetical protein
MTMLLLLLLLLLPPRRDDLLAPRSLTFGGRCPQHC